MEENSKGNKLYNNNESQTKKIIIKFPKYISNKELEKLRKKFTHELNAIAESNLYLQQSNMNNNASKRNSFIKYFKEVHNPYNLNKKDNSKINSDLIIKKHLIKKLINKKINNPRKYLEETTNKFIPKNLLDFIHPYEYLFNHKIKNNSKNSKNKELKLNLSDNNFNNIKTDKNLFNKKIKYFSRNKTHHLNITSINKTEIQKNSFKPKQKIIKTESNFFNNKIPEIKKLNRNKKLLISNDNFNTSNNKIFITENNLTKDKNRKKDFLKSLSNISGESKKIKKELIFERLLSSRRLNYEDKQKNKIRFNLDKMIQNLLGGEIYINKITERQIIKNLFRQKKINYFSDLTRQYSSSYNKKTFRSPNNKKFMKELMKMDILEKKESLMNDYQYKNNYGVKIEVNKLQEKMNSEIRELFNKKITKMKNMNIINIESFYKNMNN